MKKIFLYIICSIIVTSAYAQSELGLHFTDRVLYRNYVNPAYMNKSTVSMGIGTNFGFNYRNSWAPTDLLADGSNGTKVISLSNLLSELDDTGNELFSSIDYNIFDLGLRFNKFQFMVGVSLNAYSGMTYPKDFIGLLGQGNAAYIGETINIAPNFDFGAYVSTSIGLAYQVNDKLSLGARVKLLNGIYTMSTEEASAINITTDEDAYQLTIESDYKFNKASEAFMINPDALEVGDGNGEEEFIESIESYEFDLGSAMDKNSGTAFDFGLTYKLNDDITIGLSALNVGGKINWDTGVQNLTSQKTIYYDGEDYSAFTGDDGADVGSSLDTLGSLLQFDETQVGFTTNLISSYNASAFYAFSESLTFGALLNYSQLGDITSTNIMVSAQKDFGKWFSVGGSYAIKSGTFDNLGLNFNLNLWPLQFYATTDNILNAFKPFDAKNASVRAGLLFTFGKKKYYAKKDDISELE